MKAVFKHELSSYFTSLIGYVFGAFLLLFAGIYTMIVNINSKLTNFEYIFGNMSFVFLVIVPVLTMRVLAEERRQKTDQLLYALPLSMTKVVLGKYLAMLVMLVIPMAIVCLYPMILSAYGNIDFTMVLNGALGFFLLGAALLAIGMYVSSLTENQAISAGLCFVVMLIIYYMASLANYVPTTPIASVLCMSIVILLIVMIVRNMTKNDFIAAISGMVLETILLLLFILNRDSFEGLFATSVAQMSLFERFYIFVYGICDLGSIVYFLSVVAVFLFLSVQSMEKRRWSE